MWFHGACLRGWGMEGYGGPRGPWKLFDNGEFGLLRSTKIQAQLRVIRHWVGKWDIFLHPILVVHCHWPNSTITHPSKKLIPSPSHFTHSCTTTYVIYEPIPSANVMPRSWDTSMINIWCQKVPVYLFNYYASPMRHDQNKPIVQHRSNFFFYLMVCI